MEYKTSPIKAIREKCLHCCCGAVSEVRDCTCATCPLYPYRLGKNPFSKKREMTDEQKEAAAERLREARKAKQIRDRE